MIWRAIQKVSVAACGFRERAEWDHHHSALALSGKPSPPPSRKLSTGRFWRNFGIEIGMAITSLITIHEPNASKCCSNKRLCAKNGRYFETFEGVEPNLISLGSAMDYGQDGLFFIIFRRTAQQAPIYGQLSFRATKILRDRREVLISHRLFRKGWVSTGSSLAGTSVSWLTLTAEVGVPLK